MSAAQSGIDCLDCKVTAAMRSAEERIAVLEERNDTFKEQLEDIETTLTNTNVSLAAIDKKLAKQQSFWAGVTFLATIVGVLIRAGWDYVQKSLQ